VSAAELTDTHCHLELIEERGEGEAALAVEDARTKGVTRIINIGLGPDNANVVDRANQHPGVYAAVGWHPHQKQAPSDEDLQRIRYYAEDPDVIAIGEIGLDYYWRPGYHEVPEETQKESFRRMLRLAGELDLPVIVHDREAHDDVLALITEVQGTRGAMHAFSGNAAFAKRCLGAGMWISVAGPVTYPKADELRAALSLVPLDRLLVETDAPFLPPQPWRGEPSRPAMVVETGRRVAEVKGVGADEIAYVTTTNAADLFGLKR
jgi:TatD DNase family protein